jgi:hypothetical protein
MSQTKPSEDHRVKRVIENAKWVDKILMVGTLAAGMIVLFKLLNLLNIINITTIDIGSLKNLPITNGWLFFVIFLLLTFAHYWTGILLLSHSLHKLWQANSSELSEYAFNEVTTTGGIFVRGLIPRIENVGVIYLIDMRDPSAWAAHAAALALIFAIVPWYFAPPFFILLVLAIVLMFVNWMIGSNWIILLSELKVEHDKAGAHMRIERMQMTYEKDG